MLKFLYKIFVIVEEFIPLVLCLLKFVGVRKGTSELHEVLKLHCTRCSLPRVQPDWIYRLEKQQNKSECFPLLAEEAHSYVNEIDSRNS